MTASNEFDPGAAPETVTTPVQVPVNVGVIGAGKFGTYHARQYAKRKDTGATLVGIFDPAPKHRAALADELGVIAFANLNEMISHVDAVSITAPAIHHFELAQKALSAGKHVLVEKPVAATVEQADILIDLAAAQTLVLQVGHQERFVFDAFGILDRDVEPIAIEGVRQAPYNGRAMDVSVVLDLMTHDLDMMHQVAPGPVVKVRAEGRRQYGEPADEVVANLVLQSGCEVTFTASRLADHLRREMKLIYPDGEIFIDFVNRTLTNTTPAKLWSPFEDDADDKPSYTDPLGANIQSFIDAIRNGSTPKITGADGRRALDTALKITDAIVYAPDNNQKQ